MAIRAPSAPPKPTALLLKVKNGPGGAFTHSMQEIIRGAEPLMNVDVTGENLGMAHERSATWFRTEASDDPWDQAHAMMRRGFAAGAGELLAVEPEFEQQWEAGGQSAGCSAEPQNGSGGRAVGPHPHWHLDPTYSGLAAARKSVPDEAQRRVLVAHLDTGFDPDHHFVPAHVAAGQRSFVKDDDDPDSAKDVTPPGGIMRNRGHGTGTIGILAGPDIGGAPGVSVLPIRIADSVVRFRTGTMVQGFEYAVVKGARVLSMSMGGLASAILADAVNKAYAAGLVMISAAGNNYGGLPVRSIVYPARMRRVVAACGVMADLKSYSGLHLDTMEGCYGPPSKMLTALSAFTPNIPWPKLGCPSTVDEDGQGTSSATPQLAAAAALWIAKYWDELEALPEKWMRGEAVRRALFHSASLGSRAKPDSKLGWGALRAVALLGTKPSDLGKLEAEQEASAAWQWVKLLVGHGTGLAAAGLGGADRLLGLELIQLTQRDPAVATAIDDPDASVVRPIVRKRVLEAAEASPLASRSLRAAIGSTLRGRTPSKPLAPPPISETGDAVINPVAPPERRELRIYALDPSLGGALNSYEDQVATIEVRNEDLKPGPVGEYIEVVDVDPATDRFYPPVDLENRNLLKQKGVRPSEGDPAFHQQMVYTVAMRTIENFELALGRRALWSSRWSGRTGDPNQYVPRLRIYPHALRQENAYYSPDKKALLFGYFPANSKVSDLTPPGTMVFSCLSADIIAHETTHALLDGQARTFSDLSNPDVRAFHEAFADIAALFQQFTYRDLVRRQLARHRGDLSAASLLGALAKQFGEGTGKAGPLRRYPEIDPDITYETTFETHKRGSLLVAAVYRAFLAIVERRTADLVRLATSGTGILPEGAIHPDLVDRLTDETTKAAKHVLTMCIRALDYTPPVDITFGEYLRAIITADMEEYADDRLGYRVAFLEAFRIFQILPRNLRTVSADTLCWRVWDGEQPRWLMQAIAKLDISVTPRATRRQIFEASEKNCATLRDGIRHGLNSQADCDPLGLQYRLKYFSSLTHRGYSNGTTLMVENVRVARRVRPDGELAMQLVAVVRQRRPEAISGSSPGDGSDRFWFRGGATLVIDLFGPNGPQIRYVIRKPILSPGRLSRERAFRSGDVQAALRSIYFGAGGSKGFLAREPFALMHAERD